jgi:acyl-lipid omega-6 desaturase (Delta-12 desaturase)
MNRDLYKGLRNKLTFRHQWPQFALYAVEDGLLWGGFFYFLTEPLALSWLASIPFAILMFRNFAFMHEAVHGVAAPFHKLNYVFGLFAGSVCFLPFTLWRAIHIEHHYWTGNFDKDPVLEVVKRYPHSSNLMKAVFTVMWRTRFPLMAFFQYIVFWYHSLLKLAQGYRDPNLWLSLFCPLLLWGGLIYALSIPQLAVIGLGVFLYSLLFDFINLPHHVGVYSYDPEEKKKIWDQHPVVRSCRYPWIVEHLVLNFNFHTEHHMMPDLPWHELPMAHGLIKDLKPRDGEFHFIQAGWLAKQRSKTFAEFLRPDLAAQKTEKKQAA